MDYKNSILSNLKHLHQIYKNEQQPFKANAYLKAYNTIYNLNKPIFNINDVQNLPSIGKSIISKIQEIMNNGFIKDVEEKNNQNDLLNQLTNIHGVGPKKANELLNNGININNIYNHLHLLNNTQKIGLQYYHDFLQSIPRTELDKHYNIIKKCVQKVDKNLIFEIVGSYRRGSSYSGDIDVLITSDNHNMSTTLYQIIDKMKEINYLYALLGKGVKKALCVCKLPSHTTYRRVDLLITNKNQYPFALLYFTGNFNFNLKMRNVALKKGYILNEYGLYHKHNKQPVEKLFENENDIFQFLDMEYVKPSLRM